MLSSARPHGIAAIVLSALLATACNKGYELTTSGSSSGPESNATTTTNNPGGQNPGTQPSPTPSQPPSNQIPVVIATAPDDCSNTKGATGTTCPLYFTLSFSTTHTISFEWILSSTTPTTPPPTGEVWGVPGVDYLVGTLQKITFNPGVTAQTGTWTNISGAGKKFRAEYNVSNCMIDGQSVACSELGFN